MRLAPLVEALRQFILSCSVIHADETPVSLLAPERGKTKRAYVWVYRTTNFALQRAVLFDFSASSAAAATTALATRRRVEPSPTRRD